MGTAMGWVELFTDTFREGEVSSFVKIVGDTDEYEVGMANAENFAIDLYEMLRNRDMWSTDVLGLKISYDLQMHVVLYLHDRLNVFGQRVMDVAHVVDMWGAESLCLGYSDETNSAIIRWL